MSFLGILTLAGLAACGSYRGIAEFTLYQTAFDKTYTTSTAILDQLAVAERQLFLDHNPESETTSFRFNPDLAAYYTDSVDPPGTAAFRRALTVTKTYNDLLYGLASGQTANALVARLSELEVNVGKAAGESQGLLAAVTKVPSLSGLAGIATGLDAGFTAMKPFLQLGINFRSREQFRLALTGNYPAVRKLLVELRNGTPVVFPVLTAMTLRAVRNSDLARPLTQAENDKIKTYRKLLSDWVILIDGTILALDRAEAAATAAPTLSDSISGLNNIAVDLQATEQSARKHLAELATK